MDEETGKILFIKNNNCDYIHIYILFKAMTDEYVV